MILLRWPNKNTLVAYNADIKHKPVNTNKENPSTSQKNPAFDIKINNSTKNSRILTESTEKTATFNQT